MPCSAVKEATVFGNVLQAKKGTGCFGAVAIRRTEKLHCVVRLVPHR